MALTNNSARANPRSSDGCSLFEPGHRRSLFCGSRCGSEISPFSCSLHDERRASTSAAVHSLSSFAAPQLLLPFSRTLPHSSLSLLRSVARLALLPSHRPTPLPAARPRHRRRAEHSRISEVELILIHNGTPAPVDSLVFAFSFRSFSTRPSHGSHRGTVDPPPLLSSINRTGKSRLRRPPSPLPTTTDSPHLVFK